jgi:hypothetical protein
MLPDQDYCVPQVTVTRLVWNNDGMMISMGNGRNLEGNLLECNFVHQECYMKSPGMNQNLPYMKPAFDPLN